MTRGIKRLILLNLVLVGLLLTVSVSPASAVLYDEYPCAGNPETWMSPGNETNGRWGVWTDCPNGYEFISYADPVTGDPATNQDLPVEFPLESVNAPIQRVSANVQREFGVETGIKLSMRLCRMTTCGPSVSSTSALTSPLVLDIEDDQVPPGAVTLRIRLECEIAECAPGATVRLTNLQITRRDDTPPVISLYEPNENFEPLPEASKWSNASIRFNFDGGDAESGLDHLKIEIEDQNLCFKAWDPLTSIPGCTMFEAVYPFDEESPFIQASTISDGLHEFRLYAVNRANMTTLKTMMVKTDVTKPQQPYQFEVSPHFNGWQSSRDVRIDWTNLPGETVETATQSGIKGFTYDVDPKFGGVNPPTSEADPDPVTVNESAADSLQLRLPGAGQWTVEIKTFDRAGNVSSSGTAAVNIDNTKLSQPNVISIDPINAQDRQTGRTIMWDPGANSVSGICGYDWAMNAVAGYNPGEDPSSPLLGDDPTQLHLTPSQIQAFTERPQRFHLRAYSCAGVPGEIAHESVIVDFTAPTVTISPEDGSLAPGEPISIGAEDLKIGTTQSGVASVTCLINGNDVPCENGSELSLAGGVNQVVVTAVDVAGNSVTEEADFVADTGPPTGWIKQPSSADPTLVQASVRDADSGVKSAEVQFKPAAGGSWMKLGNAFKTDTPTTAPVELSARIPDDGELADGNYLLRVRVVDATDTGAFVTLREGGEPARFSMPLRASAVLTAGLVRSAGGKTEPLTRLGVGYGSMPLLVGSLKRPDGTPIAGAQLSVIAGQDGSPTHTIGTLTTAADGSYKKSVPIGGSRRLIVRFEGSLAARSTAAEAHLRVRGKVSLRASSASVRSRKKIHLRGKVFFGGATLPLLGKDVRLRFTVNGKASRLGDSDRTDSAGSFDFSFSYPARRRPVRFTVRAVATAEPTWAFTEGVSKSVKFVVKP